MERPRPHLGPGAGGDSMEGLWNLGFDTLILALHSECWRSTLTDPQHPPGE